MKGPEVWREEVHDLYRAVQARLWRAVLGWSGSRDVADEAVAEAFAQLLRRGADGVRDPEAWVWRSAFRIAAGDLARRRARGADEDLDGIDRAKGVEDRLPDDAVVLLEALRDLSEQQRRAVVLVDGAGHTAVSAAEILGTSAATVRVQLMRARRRLRDLLGEPTDAAVRRTASARGAQGEKNP